MFQVLLLSCIFDYEESQAIALELITDLLILLHLPLQPLISCCPRHFLVLGHWFHVVIFLIDGLFALNMQVIQMDLTHRLHLVPLVHLLEHCKNSLASLLLWL